MKIKLRSLLLIVLSIFMIGLVGCGNDKASSDNNNSSSDTATTKEEYVKYLNDRYTHHLGNSALSNDYNIYSDNYSFKGTNEEFITGYGTAYGNLKTQLTSLKKVLETNVKKGTTEVDKLNKDVMDSIDKTIASIDKFNETYSTKVKDYGSSTKEEMITGFKDIGKAPHDARMELDKLVKDAKNTLGVK
ncbi:MULTISPECIES: hypothetical protein [Clostridium]|uniref:Lipoprotein n=1 Tax=Clostridium cadaveris TaxID=1529 RepID=A0A1I2MT42_9CLOT|nr:hypothetical protein [Clostridium cadaveris]MDM8312490.1 hypothetical protein [Clostridium cadaveris]MDU4951847.1 hypothetical protein [Clostridium sp.]SFF92261.1 hypothetical protein SAMN04487885_11584 [Clostridium cadaveris]